MDIGKQGGLSEQQARLVDALSGDGGDPFGEAGYELGVPRTQATASAAVQAALLAQRQGKLKTVMARKALAAIEKLIDADSTPAATRFAASKWVLEQAGHTDAGNEAKDKPLHEMSEGELMAFMARAQKVVDEGGSAPLIAVVPGSGAL